MPNCVGVLGRLGHPKRHGYQDIDIVVPGGYPWLISTLCLTNDIVCCRSVKSDAGECLIAFVHILECNCLYSTRNRKQEDDLETTWSIMGDVYIRRSAQTIPRYEDYKSAS